MKPRSRIIHTLISSVLVSSLIIGPAVAPAWGQSDVRELRRPWDSVTDRVPSSFRREGEPTLRDSMMGRQREGLQPSEMSSLFREPTIASVAYQVHLVGEVNNPGTYRIMASDRLQEVLQRAGGITQQGSLRGVQIRRKGSATKLSDLLRFQLFGELQHNPYLLDNDVVYVPLRKAAIQVLGSVKRPNLYELRNERVLTDAIALAGGLTIGAAQHEPIRLIRFIDGEKNVLSIPNDPAELQRTAIQNGDVIFVPNVISAKREFDYNLAKLPGDQIFYPSYEDRVFVLGGVYNPGPYPFNPYATVNHYLTLAGGPTKLARVNNIKLITQQGKKRRIRKDDVEEINPGDSIFVPEPRIAPEGWIGIVTGLATFGLSTTATVLSLTR